MRGGQPRLTQASISSGSGAVTLGDTVGYIGPALFLDDGRDRLLSYEARTGRCWLGTVNLNQLQWAEVGNLPFTLGARLPGAWVGSFLPQLPGQISQHGILLYDTDRRDWWYGFLRRLEGTFGQLIWNFLGNTTGFGDLLDGRHLIRSGLFHPSPQDYFSSILFNYVVDGNWFHGTVTPQSLDWRLVANTRGFGDLLDGRHIIVQAFFPWPSASVQERILFNYAEDGNWWLLGLSEDQRQLHWRSVGNTRGFGNIVDGRHLLVAGDFGPPRSVLYPDILLMNFWVDGNWFVGDWTNDGRDMLYWPPPLANTGGFGNLLDSRHGFWVGRFGTVTSHDTLLMYSSSDGDWWRIEYYWSTGPYRARLNWQRLGNTRGFGNVFDGRHLFFTGQLIAPGKDEIMFNYLNDGHWFLGYLPIGPSRIEWRQLSEAIVQP